MKVEKVNPINFESLKMSKRMTDNMCSSVSSLLIRMNAETSKVTEGDHFKSTIVTKLRYNNAVFEDERRLRTKTDHKSQMQGFSNLKIGKKIVMDIDNATGEIIECIKPFYKPMFWVLRQAEKILSDMRNNFYDKNLVQKETLTIRDLTPEGAKKMEKFVLQVEKQRLESVVKELEESTGSV